MAVGRRRSSPSSVAARPAAKSPACAWKLPNKRLKLSRVVSRYNLRAGRPVWLNRQKDREILCDLRTKDCRMIIPSSPSQPPKKESLRSFSVETILDNSITDFDLFLEVG